MQLRELLGALRAETMQNFPCQANGAESCESCSALYEPRPTMRGMGNLYHARRCESCSALYEPRPHEGSCESCSALYEPRPQVRYGWSIAR